MRSTPIMLLVKSDKCPKPARFGPARSTQEPDESEFFGLLVNRYTSSPSPQRLRLISNRMDLGRPEELSHFLYRTR